MLEAQKQDLENEKSIVEEQASVLSEYAKSLKAEHVSTQDMGSFMQSFVAQKKDALKEFSELKEKILLLERQIAKERERLAAKKGQAAAKVSAVIVAQTGGPAKIILTYSLSTHFVPELNLTIPGSRQQCSMGAYLRSARCYR